mmetsp:Transcript_29519/g.68074  ORF Transcript_29519/g.68074 Transcript_29519/m.68074 type:complete len:302 (-) Transcript_29519:121-1026(-)
MPEKSKKERVAACRAQAEGKEPVKGAASPTATVKLVLQRQDSDGTVSRIARVLKKKCPWLGEDAEDPASATYIAASILAYSAEAKPQTSKQWCSVVQEVLSDASMVLDEDDADGAVKWVVTELSNRGILKVAPTQVDEGDIVLALLEEDDDWHEAVVQQVHEGGSCEVLFLRYGKPQLTLPTNLRCLDTVVDDEEDGEDALQVGTCEMCKLERLLTFHHLIPKDTHPTYLKKRLPSGVQGEPTRIFLNSYGIMVCRQCHSYVHRLAPNEVLAKEFNTLDKILEHEMVQRWVQWASKRKCGR